MRKRILICLAVIIVLLQGCGGVSQEEYDSLVKTNKELSEELEALKTDYEKVHSDYEELIDERTKRVEAEMKLAFPKAWAVTHFGENCIVLPENSEYLQIISKEKYTLSNDGVQAIWQKVLESCATLKQSVDDINYDKIAIKFLMEDGEEMVEFVLIRRNASYELESITGSLFDIDILLPALQTLVR